MSTTDTEPRRPIRMSEVALALATRQRPDDAPSFGIEQKAPTAEQTKAGILAVFHWNVTVPVCEQFPTADEAFNAAMVYADELRKRYPSVTHADRLAADLEASVKAAPRKAATK